MEMEMRSMEDTEIATDMTPSLVPLTFSLHHSNLHTHCSSCFSLLPLSPIPITPFLYCPSVTSSRVAGLLSNRHKLTCHNNSDEDEVSERISSGVRALATAITELRGELEPDDAVLEEAECALCAVLTNAVEVQDKEGRALGIAVYGPAFSWINHSCSPNACYRFILSPSSSSSSQESKLRIAPSSFRGSPDSRELCCFLQIDSGLCTITNHFQKEEEQNQGYGPRLIVRSIKRIKKGQEITIAYTDLLQSKAMRQLDLWSKYRFICCCMRCSVVPFTYVDHALQDVVITICNFPKTSQEISVSGCDFTSSSSSYNLVRDTAERRLNDSVDDIISEYLMAGDPEPCCEKLEKILMQGLCDELDNVEETPHYKFMLHPLHYLSLNAYTTLASAYKVRASDILSTTSTIYQNQLEAFDMSRTSAAYSLLLATTAHHLFNSESSLIASLANFWTGAGESLLYLARSSEWSKFFKSSLVASSVSKVKCSKCSLMDTFRAYICNGKIRNDDFENASNEFLDCISHDSTQKVWSFLVNGCRFLRSIKDPMDSGWLVSTSNSRATDPGALAKKKSEVCYLHESGNSIQTCEEQTCNENARVHIFELGVHCLAYGGLLAAICYGHHSHLASYVEQILDDKNNLIL
ncbi:protein SET DOMAIN GROUP 41-like isoform X3 [Arachis ipaensis]|uniref:protein SET DOMAIN GROUP 41-like isoform X3 n=1 Tax=Arachis ipaensis TaxID=130454 RepID=UPI000A2B5FFB|nr:protein SET DOMAIN GROUP 41-like isoform X3 [Arachis ipaensis]